MVQAQLKKVYVTGGNNGIGYAACKQLALEDGFFVYMGVRSQERGARALADLIAAHPECEGKVVLSLCDVSNE
jgi:NAD(P)-dependent dehydrogenase (short-subunit alcohol dehydrogenase family)